MNKNKLIYEAPEAQTFVIRFEGNLLTGTNMQVSGNRGGYSGSIDLDDDD